MEKLHKRQKPTKMVEKQSYKKEESLKDNRIRNLVVNRINEGLGTGYIGVRLNKAEILYVRYLTEGYCDYMTTNDFVECYKTDFVQKRKKEYLRDHPTIDIDLKAAFQQSGYELHDS